MNAASHCNGSWKIVVVWVCVTSGMTAQSARPEWLRGKSALGRMSSWDPACDTSVMNADSTPLRSDQEVTSPKPHQLASELTRDPSVSAVDIVPDTHTPQGASAGVVERRVGRIVLLVVLGAAIIGAVVAAVAFNSIGLAAVGAVFIIPFLLLVSAPVWLASATKAAQDQTVREQRQAQLPPG